MASPSTVEPGGQPGQPEQAGQGSAGPGRGPTRIVAIISGVLLFALVGLLAFAGGDDPDERNPLLGRRAPQVAGPTLDGGSYNIDDHRGSWVLVNFFATWCPGCVNEHPELVELEAWGGERGDLELVSVVFNDPVDRVEEFFSERGGSWPVLNNPTIPVGYQVAQIPETFLVSPAGQVVLHIEGEVSAAELTRFIEEQA